MALRLKMRLASITETAAQPPDISRGYTLHAVYGSPENESWSKYTPNGVLAFTVTNEAAERLVNGAEYYVTLDRAE